MDKNVQDLVTKAQEFAKSALAHIRRPDPDKVIAFETLILKLKKQYCKGLRSSVAIKTKPNEPGPDTNASQTQS